MLDKEVLSKEENITSHAYDNLEIFCTIAIRKWENRCFFQGW
jgi:hypothetical protein